jgi:hypothetical protein
MSDDYLMPKEAKDVPRPFLLVCEGMSDVRFVGSLLGHNKIADCNVGCPSKEGLGKGSGIDAIPDYLLAIGAITQGKGKLRGLIVFVDANDEPDKRFAKMQDALFDSGFPKPTKPFSIEGDPVRVAVFLVPGEGKTGTLDNLLLEAALKKNPAMQACLDKFCECTGNVKSWKQNKQAKMRLSTLVAASCQGNPWASASIMWSEEGNPVPVDSECFTPISAFLKRFITP